MTLRTVRLGAISDAIQYDDADYSSGIESSTPIKAGTPVDSTDVLRLTDVGTIVGDVYGPVGATDSNLAEFNGATGKALKDGGLTHANAADAISKRHDRSHAVTSTSDHSDVNLAGLADEDLMQWDSGTSKWVPVTIAEAILGKDINPNNVTAEGVIYIKERAAADADIVAYGQLWIKNTTPNELWFTDDAGTDHQIAFV